MHQVTDRSMLEAGEDGVSPGGVVVDLRVGRGCVMVAPGLPLTPPPPPPRYPGGRGNTH